jgi:CRP-like cAMP-binding protein
MKLLANTIPSLSKISNGAKNKLARCFKEKVFLSGQLIIGEGDKCKYVYLIKEGECVVCSEKNPLSF